MPTLNLQIRDSMRLIYINLLFLIIANSNQLFAESVFLKKGDIIEGKLVGETENSVSLSLPSDKIEIINKNDIIRIVYSKDYIKSVYIHKKDKTVTKAHIVYEKPGFYIIRENLGSPDEKTIRSDEVDFISDRKVSREIVLKEGPEIQTLTGGIGFYYCYGYGVAPLKYESNFVDVNGNHITERTDAYFSYHSVGILFDSAVTGKSLVNFRMNFDFKFASIDNKKTSEILHYTITDIKKAYGIGFYMSWGFAFFKGDSVRFWAGPQFGFGAFWGDDSNSPPWSYSDFFIGIGAVSGINFILSEKFAVCVEGGYRLFSHSAAFRSNKEKYVQVGSEYYENVVFVSGPEHEFFLGVAAVFIRP